MPLNFWIIVQGMRSGTWNTSPDTYTNDLKSDPFVLHNPPSHSYAYTQPIFTWSWYPAIQQSKQRSISTEWYRNRVKIKRVGTLRSQVHWLTSLLTRWCGWHVVVWSSHDGHMTSEGLHIPEAVRVLHSITPFFWKSWLILITLGAIESSILTLTPSICLPVNPNEIQTHTSSSS